MKNGGKIWLWSKVGLGLIMDWILIYYLRDTVDTVLVDMDTNRLTMELVAFEEVVE